MKENITVDELWECFSEHRKALANEYQVIASDEDQGVEIYVAEDGGFPCFSVEVDGEEVHNVKTYSYLDAEKTYDNLLSTYIYPDDDEEDYVSGDEERVNEIIGSVEDMLTVMLDEDPAKAGISPQEIDEIASIVEEYLFENFGFSIRHPTNVDGVMVQYPFGDPDEGSEDIPDPDSIDQET